METAEDKYSIKNMLFTKAIPNFVLPANAAGHKIYGCMDCGDKFTLESSYNYHVNRKSLFIGYTCRYCNKSLTFFNRCNFLSHIRTHAFKTATINISDLKIEPLPLSFFDKELLAKYQNTASVETSLRKLCKTICNECKEDITVTGKPPTDRVKHFSMKNQENACPICMFTISNECGFKAHLRLHFKVPPYHCPECGIPVPFKNGTFTNHACEGFAMMKSTTRVNCPTNNCHVFHPSDIKQHFKQNHLVKVWKCPHCFVACFDQVIINRHLSKAHGSVGAPIIFYQCDMCPGRLVFQNQLDNHLKNHTYNNVYPCWTCGSITKDVQSLLEHHILKHGLSSDLIKNTLDARTYRVVKRCDKCKRNFTYKCKFDQIQKLPNECPYNCSSDSTYNTEVIPVEVQLDERFIICHICKEKVSECWDEIKKHYQTYHKKYRCLDAKLVLERISTPKRITKVKKRNRKPKLISKLMVSKSVNIEVKEMTPVANRNNGCVENLCLVCFIQFDSKDDLESHLIDHRDPCMAYQCMECGKSFVVKPTFSMHLLIEHNISDTDEYIEKKKCYNESALLKHQNEPVIQEPVRENQCSICRDQFNDAESLEKHFRVHGMAFLIKNNSNKNSP